MDKKLIIDTIYDLVKDGSTKNIDWETVSGKEILSENFMRNHQKLLHWRIISESQTMSESFLKEFKTTLRWDIVCTHHLLSESFLEEIQEDVFIDWENFSTKKITEETIRHYEKYIFWNLLSTYSNLSENVIRNYKDKVFWIEISEYQILSEKFINEFKDRVYWTRISRYQKISYEFILQNISKINILSLSQNKLIELSIRQWEEIGRLDRFKLLFTNKP
jgi:hypothetical protein